MQHILALRAIIIVWGTIIFIDFNQFMDFFKENFFKIIIIFSRERDLISMFFDF
jgi:hypothetical protein